jgi:ArsR family transcriptional regulator
MSYSKKSEFDKKDQDISFIFKALGHPARLAILKVLAKYNTCMCGEIVAELPLSQSTVSQHLKELRSIGVINGKQNCSAVVYSINKKAFKKAEKKMKRYFSKLNSKLSE